MLGQAIARAMRRVEAAVDADGASSAEPSPVQGSQPGDPGGGSARELDVTMLAREIEVAAGERDVIRVRLRNLTLGEIRGEAQVISPHETWSSITPWTQGFAVGPGDEAVVDFAVAPPHDHRGGTYWALVKVMYFGRLQYTESISIRMTDRGNGYRAPRRCPVCFSSEVWSWGQIPGNVIRACHRCKCRPS